MSSNAPIRAIACAVGFGLVLVQAALAAEAWPTKFKASDQAAAKAVTLKAADMGPGWTGGAKKPDLTLNKNCPQKVSDLVVTGAAMSEFRTQGTIIVTSESNILKSPAMATADWKRSVGNTAWMIACAHNDVDGAADFKLVSFKKLAFPKLTHRSARYRMVADAGKKGSSVRIMVDMIVLGQGRTEIELTLSGLYSDRASADIAERAMADLLVRRITT